MAIDFTPPASDQVEISVFGPGVGEGLCIHLGDGEWMLVDSCLDPKTSAPAALDYLKQLNVDISQAVKCVVITHWHDDHVKGMGEIARLCSSATFHLSSAMRDRAFTDMIAFAQEIKCEPVSVGTSEMRKVMQGFIDAKRLNKSLPIAWAVPDRRIWNSNGIEVWTLSPSDYAVSACRFQFQRCVKKIKTKPGVLPTPKENLCAVALWISTPQFSALLGSDLECNNNPNMGWDSVLASTNRPPGRAKFVKIPHHGSPTGHHNDIWNNMITQNREAVGLVTCFNRSNLPSPMDIERIKNHTASLYQTTPGKPEALPKREKVVEQMMKQTVSNRKVTERNVGHIQLRISPSGESVINLNQHAARV